MTQMIPLLMLISVVKILTDIMSSCPYDSIMLSIILMTLELLYIITCQHKDQIDDTAVDAHLRVDQCDDVLFVVKVVVRPNPV